MMEGSPKTPHELFGIDVHKGWRPLVEPIIERIQELNEQGAAIEILQIKEKFGDLEFYVQNATQEICDMIKTAQKQAGRKAGRHFGGITLPSGRRGFAVYEGIKVVEQYSYLSRPIRYPCEKKS